MGLLHLLLAQMHNQFVGGGLVLMLTGSVIALLRAVPQKTGRWIKRRITVEVEVLNSDPLFDYVTTWLDGQPYSRRSRKLTATTSARTSDSEESSNPGGPITPKVFLSPAPGTHFFIYRRNLIQLERTRDTAPTPSGGGGSQAFSLRKHESYTITLLGKNQSALRMLIGEIVEAGAKPTETIRLFTSSFGYWHSTGTLRPRKLESVILPEGVAEAVLADAKRFFSSADWYRSVGIPWHRGYLLHGLAGTGKSSLVAALAGELRKDLYLLNLAGCGMDDGRLSSLMGDIRAGTVILLEDIDCTAPTRESDKTDRVTLSGLLNCLDGVHSQEGCLVFMTTNHRESLDQALTRPGRVDVSLEFGPATDEQIVRLARRLAPDADENEVLSDCSGKTMAEVQQALIDPMMMGAPLVRDQVL